MICSLSESRALLPTTGADDAAAAASAAVVAAELAASSACLSEASRAASCSAWVAIVSCHVAAAVLPAVRSFAKKVSRQPGISCKRNKDEELTPWVAASSVLSAAISCCATLSAPDFWLACEAVRASTSAA